MTGIVDVRRARGRMSAAQVEALHLAVEQAEEQLLAHADRLRETAAELRSGAINPWHAANRIKKIADELAVRVTE